MSKNSSIGQDMWMDLDMPELGLEFGGLFNENEKEILNLPQVDQEENGLAQLKEDDIFKKPQDQDILESIVSQMELDKVEVQGELEPKIDGQAMVEQASFFIDPSTSDQVFLPSSLPQTVTHVQPAPALSPSSSMSSDAMSPCSSSSEDTQSLIEEMEEFLVQQEQDSSQDGTEEAEKLLDALIKGEITMDDEQVNNVTQLQTLDDSNIVIVIANDEGEEDKDSIGVPSPAQPDENSISQVDSDSDWTPELPIVKKRGRGRPPQEQGRVTKRGPYNTKSRRGGKYNLKDKKERKKLQNVVAARRYRDKKKNELNHVEVVEADLSDKNRQLKEELAEMEGEVKTLKKLLVELGLVTIQ